MAKSLLRLQARKLRKKGISVARIAQYKGIAKSTVSLWTNDIILSVEQLEELKNRSIKGAELGRLRSALLQRNRRVNRIADLTNQGVELTKNLTERELFLIGIALYWAEGCRKSKRVELCNSDPRMIKLFVIWLDKNFHINRKDLVCYLKINEMHRKRELQVKQYWADIIGVSLDQFRKTYFKVAANKKIYENFNQHYGTISVRVPRSGDLSYKILGLIEGISQGSSVVEHRIHIPAVVSSILTPGT